MAESGISRSFQKEYAQPLVYPVSTPATSVTTESDPIIEPESSTYRPAQRPATRKSETLRT